MASGGGRGVRRSAAAAAGAAALALHLLFAICVVKLTTAAFGVRASALKLFIRVVCMGSMPSLVRALVAAAGAWFAGLSAASGGPGVVGRSVSRRARCVCWLYGGASPFLDEASEWVRFLLVLVVLTAAVAVAASVDAAVHVGARATRGSIIRPVCAIFGFESLRARRLDLLVVALVERRLVIVHVCAVAV